MSKTKNVVAVVDMMPGIQCTMPLDLITKYPNWEIIEYAISFKDSEHKDLCYVSKSRWDNSEDAAASMEITDWDNDSTHSWANPV